MCLAGSPSGNEACCANCVTWREREIKVWLRPFAGAAAETAGTDGSGFLKIPAEAGGAAATVNAQVVV